MQNQSRVPPSSPTPPAAPPAATPSPRFTDVLGLLLVFVLLLCFLSYFNYRGLKEQVRNGERAVEALREKDAALQQQIEEAELALQLTEAEQSVPHPSKRDRDANLIGDHADVSWSYDNQDGARYVSYEVELFRNRLHTERTDTCEPQLSALERFWEGCSQGPVHFMASDPVAQGSRIPPDLDHHLIAGNYSWRVASVRADSKELNENNALSGWSDFGAFSIDPSLAARISATNVVRVGTNFEQDTNFSRTDENGSEVGLDISLIQTLIEGCIQLNGTEFQYLQKRCESAVNRVKTARSPAAPHAGSQCKPGDQQLCVKFVSVGNWGDWQAQLRSKEIDIFIGSLTRARERERGGIVFTDGYLPYRTRLYARRTDFENSGFSLNNWLKRKREIGVIRASSNENLLDHLLQDKQIGSFLHKTPVPSFPALESAMDHGEVDGVLIDDTFVSLSTSHWTEVSGLTDTDAWKAYKREFIGYEDQADDKVAEQVAIATVQDDPTQQHSLYHALQDALRSSEVQETLLPTLCHRFWHEAGSETCSVFDTVR